jgi:hypothetical protein
MLLTTNTVKTKTKHWRYLIVASDGTVKVNLLTLSYRRRTERVAFDSKQICRQLCFLDRKATQMLAENVGLSRPEKRGEIGRQ